MTCRFPARCSAARSRQPIRSSGVGGLVWGHGEGPDAQRVRFVARRVVSPSPQRTNPNDTRAYVLLVAGNVSELEDEEQHFNGTLIWSFALWARV